MSSAGTVACVTGGGRGIGRAAALRLARSRAHVEIVDVDAAAAERVAGEIRGAGGSAVASECDVSLSSDVTDLFAAIGARHRGRLDVLVASAAVFPCAAVADTSPDLVDRVLGVNFRGAVACALAARPLMAAAGGGSMVFLTSGSGRLSQAAMPAQRGFALYGASKAALDRWVLGVAPELAVDGIAVHCLCPGATVLTEGVLALGPPAAGTPTIGADAVAEVIAELAALRGGDHPGRRLEATAVLAARREQP